MLGIFNKKSKTEVLQVKYQKLMKEYHRLSTIDRAASDQKYAEADLVAKEIEDLQKNS